MRAVFFGASSGDSGPTPEFIVPELTAEELRVLGCLIEKQFLTPDVYPLTLNSLVSACNQKTSREPITSYDDITVDAVLVMLQGRGLCAKISGADHRVPKFKELFGEKTGLRVSEIAVVCVMMLRGPQTLNELKVRTDRIHAFADLDEVETVVDKLTHRTPQPLVVKMPRLTGQKEQRYTHLLAGPVDAEAAQSAAAQTHVSAPPPREDRIGKLEAEVAALKETVVRLEQQLADFRRQFE
ncbi:MAG: YceH family protein [Bryobacterales bacterium]|nr:YceH family protein [Bryobacterales bacterium]